MAETTNGGEPGPGAREGEVVVIPRANLRTLDGIGEARENVFNALAAGQITPEKGRELEKMLRGQQALKAELRLKFLQIIGADKRFAAFAADLAQGISEFVNGTPALPPGTPEPKDH